MTINVQAVNFEAKPGLEEYLEKKLSKLETLSDKIISAKVFFKVENKSSKDDNCVDIKLELPGDDIFVGKCGQSFEECIDLAVDTLKMQIVRMKEKENNR